MVQPALTFDLRGSNPILFLLMRVCVFQSRLLGGIGLLLATAVLARAEVGAALSSPFLPAGGAPVAAVTTNGSIEYHGYMATPTGERFSIYNTTKKTATWVGLNERGNPFVVRSHHLVGSGADQITVEYQGSSLVLALKEARILAVAAAPVLGVPPGMAPVTAPAVAGNPPNLPAGASLDEWAAEVQRRRVLRQQPTPPAGTPAAPAPATPAPSQGASPPAATR